MSRELLQKGIDTAIKATEEDKKKHYIEALRLYDTAVETFFDSMKNEVLDGKAKDTIKSKCKQYLGRAEMIRNYFKKGNISEIPVQADEQEASSKEPPSDYDSYSNDDDSTDKKINKKLEKTIVVEKPDVRWDDVVGLKSAKATLKETAILPVRFPQMFTGKRKAWRGILLYGPPGTGKTFLAKAVATEANNSTFFSVSSSDLVSKWMGESEQHVKTLFEMARERKPSIIFIDEMDALMFLRSDQESETARRIKQEFLIQMRGVGKSNDGVLVLGATNIPWMLDAAIARTFDKKVYIPLPDESARTLMFKLNLGNTPHDLQEADFRHLGEKTEGFSGENISMVVRDSLMQPLRKVQIATHFKKVHRPSSNIPYCVDELYTPCFSWENVGIEMSWESIPFDKLLEPIVSKKDMLQSLANCKPSVNKDDLDNLKKFREDFGQEGYLI